MKIIISTLAIFVLFLCSGTSLKAQNQVIHKNILAAKEYGDYYFHLPCDLHQGILIIKFISETNRVFLYEQDKEYVPEVDKIISRGTFTLDKSNADFKYVTCRFTGNEVYKLKYSNKKKIWILLNVCIPGSEIEEEKE